MTFPISRVQFGAAQPRNTENTKTRQEWQIANQALQVLGQSGLAAMGIKANTSTELMQKFREKLPYLALKLQAIAKRLSGGSPIDG